MKKYLIIFGIVAALTACAGTGDSAAPAASQNPLASARPATGIAALRGAKFETVKNGTKITLSFDDQKDRIYGKVVNNYNSPFTADGNRITFKPMLSTMMMGLNAAAMQAESDYFKFITDGGAKTFSLSGNMLTLTNAAGQSMKFKKVN
ncbi:MAG: META domain-containing protein [Proteobacteria bacterium]|nr:META domain-containing protein [Pseudomonadota bacterium]